MESTYYNNSKEPAAHYHPCQDEEFAIIEGELTVVVNGQKWILKKGDTLHVSKNQVHNMWNNSGRKTVVNWRVQPAMDTEYFMENAIGLAVDGKTNEEGMPGLLQVALLANRFSNVFRLSKPAFVVQKIAFFLLTPLGYLKGLRPVYEKYQD